MSNVASISIESSFVKTTNAVITNKLITFIGGNLVGFSLTDGTKNNLGTYDIALGNIFYFDENIYFGNGSIANKWIL